MNQRKRNAVSDSEARDVIRMILEPVKQTLVTEVDKIKAEIRGGTEVLGEIGREQAKVFVLLKDITEHLADLDQRLRCLEAASGGPSVG
jgi:hypothetical protein